MKMMKKMFLLTLILLGVIVNYAPIDVHAATAPSTITLKSKSSMYYFSESKGTDYISGYNFYRKELSDGSLAYCVSNISEDVPAGKTLVLKEATTDKGLDYIIKNGYPNKSITGDAKKDYYITQSAIWKYFDETRGSKNWKNTTFSSTSSTMKRQVYYLVQAAKTFNNTGSYPEPTITLSVDNTSMNLSSDSKYFVSNPIKVELKNAKDTYTVNLVNAPEGTIIKSTNGDIKTTFNSSESFVVNVPVAQKDSISGSVELMVSGEGVVYKTYTYTSNNGQYQDVAPTEVYEEITKIVSSVLTLNFEKDPELTKVKISKQDITTKKELPGATLVIKNSKGEVVDTWVSTNEPHYLDNLNTGKYTLTETIAPNGYVLSTETIEFTVKNDGKVETVVMYNSRKPEATKVKISKQDITSKEELPGATLVIKNSKGEVVETWVSTSTPYYIEGLEPGKYTLTETIAPDGYVLSNETIEFTVKEDGKIQTVIMYNTPYTDVPITDLDINKTTMIVASILILLGTGVVFYYGKFSK